MYFYVAVYYFICYKFAMQLYYKLIRVTEQTLKYLLNLKCLLNRFL